MKSEDRIKDLEARLARAEARIADLEARPLPLVYTPPVGGGQTNPFPWPGNVWTAEGNQVAGKTVSVPKGVSLSDAMSILSQAL